MMGRWGAAVLACASLGFAAAMGIASCAQTPVNVPVRTFERPQKVDFVCLDISGADGGVPQVHRQNDCAPLGANTDVSTVPVHLFALVTQTTRGEVAVVDLVGQAVVDVDRSTPGINFLPVGQLPTDLAVDPDGKYTYVTAAEVNKPAIYALDNTKILGDVGSPYLGLTGGTVPTLSGWPVCRLPGAPVAIALVPAPVTPSTPDAGADAASEAGSEGGTTEAGASEAGSPEAGAPEAGAGVTGPLAYSIAVVLADSVMTLDPNVLTADPPGELKDCDALAGVQLTKVGPSAAASTPPMQPWDDGVKYVDGGVDPRDAEPQLATSCASSDAGANAEAGSDASAEAGAMASPSVRAAAAALDLGGGAPILYVADAAQPIIHVLDMSNARAPIELEPLRATSVEDPTRAISIGAIAVSPSTHEYKRFLYAIDARDGSVIIYDVTDPKTMTRAPLSRPHPELNPFQPPDRIRFNAPIAALSFARHDFVLMKNGIAQNNPSAFGVGESGIICNPNPNADPNAPNELGDGVFYRADHDTTNLISVPLGPARLRGVFAFVTLTNGTIVTIDVDDWDAPCRRPDPMNGFTSSIAPPEPAPATGDIDPYHAPVACTVDPNTKLPCSSSPVSLETFFPVSAPHRTRSLYYLRNDPTKGNHAPNLLAPPQLFKQSAPAPTDARTGQGNPVMLPTWTQLADPSLLANPTDPTNRTTIDGKSVEDSSRSLPGAPPDVRFAYEDPLVHVDQDWSIAYEGIIPGFGTSLATTVTNWTDPAAAAFGPAPGADAHAAVVLSVQDGFGFFCHKGVEDSDLAAERVRAEIDAFNASHVPVPDRLASFTGDYVQISDDVLAAGDPYWSEPNPNQCWDGELADPPNRSDANAIANVATARQATCSTTFGATLDPANPAVARDFPIYHAYDDAFVITRFGYYTPSAPTPTTREVVGPDPSNASALKMMQCCFHNQVHFNVRTGGEWLAFGTATGFLHHVTAGPKVNGHARCVQSCEPRFTLMNARAPGLPRPGDLTAVQPIYRSSPLALTNPAFAVIFWNGIDTSGATPADKRPDRDLIWKFSTRGQFFPLTMALASSSAAVSPQSMRYVPSFEQLAVIDGASQGLVLFDLNTLTFAHTPYF